MRQRRCLIPTTKYKDMMFLSKLDRMMAVLHDEQTNDAASRFVGSALSTSYDVMT